MKTFGFFILFLFLFQLTFVCAQSRSLQNQDFSFEQKTTKLTEATGWSLAWNTKKWVENKNIISDRPNPRPNNTSSIIYMQFAKFTFNNNVYHALLWEKHSGRYRYPNIRQDWYDFYRIDFLVFTDEGFQDLKNHILAQDGDNIWVNGIVNGNMTSSMHTTGGEYAYTEDNLRARIIQKILNPGYSPRKWGINSQHVNGKDVVRFGSSFSVGRKGSESENKSFSEHYFEVSLDKFKKLITYDESIEPKGVNIELRIKNPKPTNEAPANNKESAVESSQATRPIDQQRVFRDITLKHRMPARCVGVENGVALLKDNNDQIKRVPIKKLSKRDQKWLREHFPE